MSASTPALAVLAPPYQRAAELSAVIYAAVPALNPIAIESIEHVEVDLYEVRTTNCVLMVEIVDAEADSDEPARPGRREFEAVAGEPTCDDVAP